MKRLLAAALVAGVWIGCAATGAREPLAECSPGESRACTCANGIVSTQTCKDVDRTFGDCVCTAPLPEASVEQPDPRLCSSMDGGRRDGGSAKKCQVCDFDFDPSEATVCPVAPACANGSLGAPANPLLRADLTVHTDNGKPVTDAGDAGDAAAPPPSPPKGTCLDPQLRIRLQKLKIHAGGGEGYCIVEANDGVTSEAAVTMKTSNLKAGDEFPFPVGQGMLWGQAQPECTSNNLTLTYYCFKVVDNGAWTAALKAMGDTATAIGGSPAGNGPYGWAFGLGGAAANAAAAAIGAAQKDENRIKVQQTIPVSSLLDLANGRTWSIRTRVKDGCNLFGCSRDYDWELTVQAWGCADRLPETK
ncbi:MAG: hypothetical protein BGO98_46665 [Myxococcales bacterium 68-20]|nr:hypothetical protein [Myxococcales bacterium]OJY23074.1 MAG: hypothetical protein BGO98_46665 [Myxococcales bacterium 68-20]